MWCGATLDHVLYKIMHAVNNYYNILCFFKDEAIDDRSDNHSKTIFYRNLYLKALDI